MDASKDESPAAVTLLDRTSRSTRGKRMNKLLDEEIEQDELFWSQEALKEEAEDDNYVEEKEVADEFDSDFDEDEPEPEEEGDNDVDDRKEKKKRLVAPGSVSKKKMNKKKKKKIVISELDGPSQDEKVAERSTELDQHDTADGGEVERVVRKSTRTAVIVKQAERDAIRAALQATMKPIKRRKEGEEKRMTQEEMLLEAAQTEIRNLRNLERVLAREEEVKKRAIVHKVVYDGPQTRYLSINGSQYLEFRGGLSFESLLSATPIPYPKKDVCAITGLPAKYRDPKTGLPYATKEAFKIIRERFLADSKNTRIEMDMGGLFNSIDGKGFLGKRKRSPVVNGCKTPHIMRFAQFGMAPAIEIEDSDSD